MSIKAEIAGYYLRDLANRKIYVEGSTVSVTYGEHGEVYTINKAKIERIDAKIMYVSYKQNNKIKEQRIYHLTIHEIKDIEED